MFNIEDSVLIRSAEYPGGYRIAGKNPPGFVLWGGTEEKYIKSIEDLLTDGAEIFETEEDYIKKYPPLTSDEIKANGMKFWEKIPQEKWTKDVREYFEQKDKGGV